MLTISSKEHNIWRWHVHYFKILNLKNEAFTNKWQKQKQRKYDLHGLKKSQPASLFAYLVIHFMQHVYIL